MVVFEYKGNNFYFDDRLNRDLTKKVYLDLIKNDKDNVFLIDGNEGSGKSKFADILAAHAALHLGCDYDIDSVCLSPEEFRNRIQDCPNRSVVIYDEAHRGMGSSRSLSEINNILKDLMMEMRQKNLFVLIVMPTFFLLDKYAALFRSKGLFHVYERKRKRGFWAFFNEENKKKLYLLGKKLLNYNVMKFPSYRGKFYNQWCINEAEYRAKKLKVFKERPSFTKAEKLKEQRDKVIKALFDELCITKVEFTEYLKKIGVKMNRQHINELILDIERGKYGNDAEFSSLDTENDDTYTENTSFDADADIRNNDITTNIKEGDDFSAGEEEFEEKIKASPIKRTQIDSEDEGI